PDGEGDHLRRLPRRPAGPAQSHAGSSLALLQARTPRVRGPDLLVALERLHLGLQDTQTRAAVPGDCETRRLPQALRRNRGTAAQAGTGASTGTGASGR